MKRMLQHEENATGMKRMLQASTDDNKNPRRDKSSRGFLFSDDVLYLLLRGVVNAGKKKQKWRKTKKYRSGLQRKHGGGFSECGRVLKDLP